MRRHTDYENMVAAYDGLSPAERKEMDRHLAECPACAADLAAFRRMDGEIRAARMLKPSAGLRVRFSEAISGASAPSAAAKPTDRVRLAPPAPKIVVRRPASGVPGGRAARFVLPVGAGVLLFVLAVFVSLQLDAGRRQEVDSSRAAVPPEQAAITKITFACEAITEPSAIAKTVLDFEAENPDIDVQFKPINMMADQKGGSDPAEAYDAAVRQTAESADVFCAIPTPGNLKDGTARNLAPFIEADATFRPDDFYPNFLQNWTKSGVVLSIPTYFGLDLIAYDPAAFKEAGILLPAPGWTWDDFLRIAAQLTKRSGDQVDRYGFADKYGMIASQRLNSELAGNASGKLSYTTMAQILSWVETLYRTSGAAPIPEISIDSTERDYAARQAEFLSLLRSKKVAMWSVDGMESGSRMNVVPLPRPTAGEAQLPGATTAGLAMSGFTRHPEESWRLISYFSQHTPDDRTKIPARRSIAEYATFWKGLDLLSTAAYEYALMHLVAWPWPDTLPPFHVEYAGAVRAVMQGEQTAEQALAELDAKGRLASAPSDLVANGTAGTPADNDTGATAMVTQTLPLTRVPGAEPLPGVPNLSSKLVQAEGESEEDFLARIAAADVLTESSGLLIMSAPASPDSALSARTVVGCWFLQFGRLIGCPAEPVEQVLAARANMDETVVRFSVTFYKLFDKVVTYEVEARNGGETKKQQYRVVLREQDRRWREEWVQQVD